MRGRFPRLPGSRVGRFESGVGLPRACLEVAMAVEGARLCFSGVCEIERRARPARDIHRL
ncbi:hypothetical protein METHP14_440037 [Pseudomonas sp. P14-2025]